MRKLVFILLPILFIILYFVFRTPPPPPNEVSQKPIYTPGTPEYIQQVHQVQIERGESGRTDLWNLKIEKNILAEAHKAAVKCISFKSEKPTGPMILIFSINADGILNNFDLDPPIDGAQIDQPCLTTAYQGLGPRSNGRKTDPWGRDRFQASEFVNQK